MADEYICRPKTSRHGNAITYTVYRRASVFGIPFWVHAFNSPTAAIANEIINSVNGVGNDKRKNSNTTT